MARDVLYEESFNPTNLKLKKAMYMVYRLLKIINAVVAAVLLYFGIMFFGVPIIILGLLFLGSALLFWWIQRISYYCVDCNFVNGKTWLVKVINYKIRRKIIIYEYSEVEQVGKVGSASFEKLYQSKEIKKIYATPNKYAENAYYVFLKQDGVAYLVMMDCKEDYLANLVSFTGKRVIEKDYNNDIS